MKKSNKFSPEVRERTARILQEQRGEYPSLWVAIKSIALKIGWYRRHSNGLSAMKSIRACETA